MKNPRISVTVESDDYDLLRRLSEVMDVSMASLLREYLEMSRPMLRHMLEVSELLRKSKQESKELHGQAIRTAMSEAEVMLEQLTGQRRFLLDQADIVGSLIDEGSKELDDPQPYNMGVRSDLKGEKARK